MWGRAACRIVGTVLRWSPGCCTATCGVATIVHVALQPSHVVLGHVPTSLTSIVAMSVRALSLTAPVLRKATSDPMAA
jgi:hypothetical protein